MVYNTSIKLKDNIEAIRITLEYKSGEKLKQGELEKLKLFSGWGGIKCVLYDPYKDEEWATASKSDVQLRTKVKELHDLLKWHLAGKEYKEVVESMKNSILSSFYTPNIIPKTIYSVLQKYMSVESLYEPSAGMGVFITEAVKVFNLTKGIDAVEKDILTSKLLSVVCQNLHKGSNVHHYGLELTPDGEREWYDLIVSNIPFGNFPVYDPACKDRNMTAKIHNYFFWKGIQKIKEGGVLAYLVTNAFLDTVTNKSAREWLFMNSDFISLTVMPDNLMKESAGTEAGSHFLVVRKHTGKTEMSAEEKLLCVSVKGIYSMNCYTQLHEEEIVIGEVKTGKNQYGQPAREVWWDKPIQDIAEPFREILSRDFNKRFINKGTISDPTYEIPIGKIEIIGPNKFKWADTTDVQENQLASKDIADEMLPWDELPDHIQIPEETVERYDAAIALVNEWHQILHPEEGIQVDEFDENSTCLSDESVKQLELIPDELAQYNLKGKRERAVMEAAIKVIDCYKLLEKEEQNG